MLTDRQLILETIDKVRELLMREEAPTSLKCEYNTQGNLKSANISTSHGKVEVEIAEEKA
jgi:hypothetical protein